ncbi:MAG: Nif11-like leader peptide family natural product precursor [Ectothiorhodospiraceae bacterium]|nr:Nif11-like leader peptide family natural product precursor [Ectothiorhodospiraceae bacterium]
MSMEDVQRFLSALAQDEDLAVRADDAYVEALHRVASGAGYAFSEDDLRGALDATAADLADSDLEGVVGGFASMQFNTATLSAGMNTAFGGLADTVYGGGTSSIVNFGGLTRFSSFSKGGYSR